MSKPDSTVGVGSRSGHGQILDAAAAFFTCPQVLAYGVDVGWMVAI
jgi:hypothetical protein